MKLRRLDRLDPAVAPTFTCWVGVFRTLDGADFLPGPGRLLLTPDLVAYARRGSDRTWPRWQVQGFYRAVSPFSTVASFAGTTVEIVTTKAELPGLLDAMSWARGVTPT